MKTIAIRVAVALLLAAGAWVCWREARLVDRRGRFTAGVGAAPLRDDRPGGAWLDGLRRRARRWGSAFRPCAPRTGDGGLLERPIHRCHGHRPAGDRSRSAVDRGQRLVSSESTGGRRRTGRGTAARRRAAGLRRRAQGGAQTAPQQNEAAYNYELVARVRDGLARAAAGKAKPDAPAALPARAQAGDLPAGPTLHGRPGAPPPEVKAEEFQIIAPMEFGDREAQPEPTPGGKLPRKG